MAVILCSLHYLMHHGALLFLHVHQSLQEGEVSLLEGELPLLKDEVHPVLLLLPLQVLLVPGLSISAMVTSRFRSTVKSWLQH